MFKPASGFKETQSYPYEYKQQNNPELDPKRNRDGDGKVKANPRNFYTNQQSTVIRSFFKPLNYIPDPYERAHEMEVDHAKKEKSLEGEAKFKLNLHPKHTFSIEKQVYGTDVEFPEVTILSFRKNQKNLTLIFINIKENGRQMTSKNQDCRATSHPFHLTWKILPNRQPEDPNSKKQERLSDG